MKINIDDIVQYATQSGITGEGRVTYIGRENGRAAYWVTKPGHGCYILPRFRVTPKDRA